MNKPQSHDLFFDPTNHPDDTLKAFNDFIKTFQLRYAAMFPDPPKVSLDAALNRWKISNTTTEAPIPQPTLQQYDQVVAEWQAKDKVAKFLGMFSSTHLHNDWLAAQPDDALRNAADWTEMIRLMTEYYKPTENSTLKNYRFRSLTQDSGETFAAFCNKVEKEAKHCSFKCQHGGCTAESTAVRDQILYGTTFEKVREEAIIKSWDLKDLRKEGMRMESACKGAAEIAGEALNRLGAYSHKSIRNNKSSKTPQSLKPITCFNCGTSVTTPIKTHVRKSCPAIGKTCTKYNNVGHLPQFCKKFPDIQVAQVEQPPTHADNDVEQTYNINIFQIDTLDPSYTHETTPHQLEAQSNHDLNMIASQLEVYSN